MTFSTTSESVRTNMIHNLSRLTGCPCLSLISAWVLFLILILCMLQKEPCKELCYCPCPSDHCCRNWNGMAVGWLFSCHLPPAGCDMAIIAGLWINSVTKERSVAPARSERGDSGDYERRSGARRKCLLMTFLQWKPKVWGQQHPMTHLDQTIKAELNSLYYSN